MDLRWAGKTLDIAVIAHEANRVYCRSIGDYSQPAWEDAPEWQRQSAIQGVRFHLDNLNVGISTNPAESHASWLEVKRKAGWVYGPSKDEKAKTHPCVMEYSELPFEQRQKDYIFGAIVKAFYDCEWDRIYDKRGPDVARGPEVVRTPTEDEKAGWP